MHRGTICDGNGCNKVVTSYEKTFDDIDHVWYTVHRWSEGAYRDYKFCKDCLKKHLLTRAFPRLSQGESVKH